MNGLFPPSLDETVIRAMKKAGFRTLNLSVGSMDRDQLQRFGRPDIRKSVIRVLEDAERYAMETVAYIIAGAPFQEARTTVRDLLFFSKTKALAGVSVFYPAPQSRDFETCRKLNLLPETFSLMRSSALPVSHTTTRKQAVTLMRLGRILNFSKALGKARALGKNGSMLPEPAPCPEEIDPTDRQQVGIRLLAGFLHDGKIRGITSEGVVYFHDVDGEIVLMFREGMFLQ